MFYVGRRYLTVKLHPVRICSASGGPICLHNTCTKDIINSLALALQFQSHRFIKQVPLVAKMVAYGSLHLIVTIELDVTQFTK